MFISCKIAPCPNDTRNLCAYSRTPTQIEWKRKNNHVVVNADTSSVFSFVCECLSDLARFRLDVLFILRIDVIACSFFHYFHFYFCSFEFRDVILFSNEILTLWIACEIKTLSRTTVCLHFVYNRTRFPFDSFVTKHVHTLRENWGGLLFGMIAQFLSRVRIASHHQCLISIGLMTQDCM